MVLKEEQCQDSLFPIIRAENAHEGITGIVAGKLKDIYEKPVIIATPCEGLLKGTGRSTDKIDMFQILDKYRDLFIRFGGHHGACGFLMSEENFETFRVQANIDLEDRLKQDPDLLQQKSQYDIILTGADMTLDFMEQLELMEPFGCKNRRPIFCLSSVTLSNQQKMGKEGNHARFFAHSPDGTSAECVLFTKAIQHEEQIYRTALLDLYGTLQLNVWNGMKKVQFVVDRIEEHPNLKESEALDS
jgi:single-stranded-DNA-specific exonuclease